MWEHTHNGCCDNHKRSDRSSQVVRTPVYATTSLLIRTTTMMMNEERHVQDYCHLTSELLQTDLKLSSIVPQTHRTPYDCCTPAEVLSTSELPPGRIAFDGAGHQSARKFPCTGITRIHQVRRAGKHRIRQFLAWCKQLRLETFLLKLSAHQVAENMYCNRSLRSIVGTMHRPTHKRDASSRSQE